MRNNWTDRKRSSIALLLLIVAAVVSLDVRRASSQSNEPDNLSAQSSKLSAQARYIEAISLIKRALVIYERGADYRKVASALDLLAGLYVAQRQFSEAEPLYKRALEIRENYLGKDDPDVATSLNNLVTFYNKQGRYADATRYHWRLLDIKPKAPGISRSDLEVAAPHGPAKDTNTKGDETRILNLEIKKLLSEGRYLEAIPIAQRVLALLEQRQAADYPDVADASDNLAEIYRATGQYDDAEPLVPSGMRLEFGVARSPVT